MTPMPDPPQHVAMSSERGVKVMTFPAGSMDGKAVRLMYEHTVEAIDAPNARLLVDTSGIDLVNSGAMGMFVTLEKKCLGVGAQMHLYVPSEHVQHALQLMRLDRVLDVHTDRERALQSFKPPAEPA